jgi:hypothetical protein
VGLTSDIAAIAADPRRKSLRFNMAFLLWGLTYFLSCFYILLNFKQPSALLICGCNIHHFSNFVKRMFQEFMTPHLSADFENKFLLRDDEGIIST